MKSSFLALALGCFMALSSGQLLTPLPGSLKASISVDSINNIVNLFAGILPSYIANNKTFNISYRDSGFGYSIVLNDIHINTLNINTKQISFVQNTNKLRIFFSAIDLDSDMDGVMTIIGIIPIYAAKLQIKNLTVQVDLEAVPLPNSTVRWQLNQATFVDLSDVTIKTTSSVWDGIINMFHGSIVSDIRSQLPRISQAVQTVVDGLNKQLKNGESLWVNVYDARYPLNLTTTLPPQVDPSKNLVTLNFDGTFYDTVHQTNHVPPNTNEPFRIPGLNSNQIFIHQSTLASLFIAIDQEIMPVQINDQAVTKQILQLFPEIKFHYGDDIQTDLFLTVTADNGNFLTLNRYSGIEIGKNEKARATLAIKCANKTTPMEVAAEFNMDLNMILNVTVDPKWKLYLNVPQVQIQNTVLTKDNVGMIGRKYDALLSTVVRSTVNNINVQWQKPFDITSLDPEKLPFLSNMFTNLHVSPFYLEEFYYIGFSYFVDPAPQSVKSVASITDRVIAQHGDTIMKIFNKVMDYIHKMKHDSKIHKKHPHMMYFE